MKKAKSQLTAVPANKRSQNRREVMESKKNNKKFDALKEIKAKREEKRKQGGFYIFICLVETEN